MMKPSVLLRLLTLWLCTSLIYAEGDLHVDFGIEKSTEGTTVFESKKFRVFHGTPQGGGLDDEFMNHMVVNLNMRMGRSTNGPYERGLPHFREYPTEEEIATEGAKYITRIKAHGRQHLYNNVTEMVLVDSAHILQDLKTRSDFRDFARYAASYVRHFFSPDDGIDCPIALEGANEPMSKAKLWSPNDEESVYDRVTDFHREYCRIIRAQFPRRNRNKCQPLCGGWAAGFVQFQFDSFDHYEQRLHRFVNGTCTDIDFLSVHLYDAQRAKGHRDRISGSGVEALRDLVATETINRCGRELPLLISEYSMGSNDLWYVSGSDGKVAREYCEPRDFAVLHSTTKMFMQFLSRPSMILKAIPFLLPFAEDIHGVPQPWTLTRKVHDPQTMTTKMEFTHIIKFFEMIYDVEGRFAHIDFDSPQVFVHAIVNDNEAFLLIKNSDETPHSIDISLADDTPRIDRTEIRRLYLDTTQERACAAEQLVRNGVPQLSIEVQSRESGVDFDVLTHLDLEPEEFVVIKHTLNSPSVRKAVSKVSHHFSKDFMKPIVGGETESFRFEDLPVHCEGRAFLRLSLGRTQKIMADSQCQITVNGIEIETDMDWTGGKLTDNWHQWAAMEYPFESSLLQVDTIVTVSCAASTGVISTVSLRLEQRENLPTLTPTPSPMFFPPQAMEPELLPKADESDAPLASPPSPTSQPTPSVPPSPTSQPTPTAQPSPTSAPTPTARPPAPTPTARPPAPTPTRSPPPAPPTPTASPAIASDSDGGNFDLDRQYVKNAGFESGARHWQLSGDVRIAKGDTVDGDFSAIFYGTARVTQRVTSMKKGLYQLSMQTKMMFPERSRIDVVVKKLHEKESVAARISWTDARQPEADWEKKAMFFSIEEETNVIVVIRCYVHPRLNYDPLNDVVAAVDLVVLFRRVNTSPAVFYPVPVEYFLPVQARQVNVPVMINAGGPRKLSCRVKDPINNYKQAGFGRVTTPADFQGGRMTLVVPVAMFSSPQRHAYRYYDLVCAMRTMDDRFDAWAIKRMVGAEGS